MRLRKYGIKTHNRICQDSLEYGIIMVETVKKDKKEDKAKKKTPTKIGCPLCGDTENLVPSGRCVTCLSCGWSKCSL